MTSRNQRMILLGSLIPSLKGCSNKYLRVITLEEITLFSFMPRNFQGRLVSCLRTRVQRPFKNPNEMAIRIEANLSSSKVEPFHAPRAKVDIKPKVVHSVETTQDIILPWKNFKNYG
jgi:hypothetical protein